MFFKFSERNPLMSIVVHNSEAICLKVMATKSHDLLKKNVKNLIQNIVTLKLTNFETGGKALAQFGKFLANEATTEMKKFLDFKSAEQLLDDLYFKDFNQTSRKLPCILLSPKDNFHFKPWAG